MRTFQTKTNYKNRGGRRNVRNVGSYRSLGGTGISWRVAFNSFICVIDKINKVIRSDFEGRAVKSI